jgi:hypothetical protein
MMYAYGFRLLDFTPSVMTCMAVFAHLCKDFAKVIPNVDLFRHFYIPRIEDKSLSGNVSWIPRGKKEDWGYLGKQLRGKWEKWRGDWCWIQDKEAPLFCVPWTESMVHSKDWSEQDHPPQGCQADHLACGS